MVLIKKKEHPKFNVPNYGVKNRSRVSHRWRKQRGTDNKKRVKKAFMGAEPTIGYRNAPSIRGRRASGKRSFYVTSVAHMQQIVSNKKEGALDYDFVVAHALSQKSRNAIVKIGEAHKLNIVNAKFIEYKKEISTKKNVQKNESSVKIKTDQPQQKTEIKDGAHA